MPTTPQRKVTGQTALQLPGASAAQFGGQEAQALGNLGGAVQGVSDDADRILKQHDTFKAQKAYNQVSETAFQGATSGTEKVPGLNDYLNQRGENAIGSSAKYSAFLDQQKQEALKNMSPRQQRIFLQNWEPKAASLKQRATQHEIQQVGAAQEQQMQLTLERQAREAAEADDPSEALAGMDAAFDALWSRGGGTAEAKAIAHEQIMDAYRADRFHRLNSLGDYEGALAVYGIPPDAIRSDGSLSPEAKEKLKEAGVLAEGSEDASPPLSQEQRLRLGEVQGLMAKDRKNAAKAVETQRQNGKKFVEVYRANNDGAIPPLKEMIPQFPTREEAEFYRKDLVTKRQEEFAEQRSEENLFRINSPEGREANHRNATLLMRRLSSLNPDPDDYAAAQTLVTTLENDTSPDGARLRKLLLDEMNAAMDNDTDPRRLRRADVMTEAVDAFNKANKAANPNWFGRALDGAVENKGLDIKSYNPASTGFAAHWAVYEAMLDDKATEMKRPITVDEFDEITTRWMDNVRALTTKAQLSGDFSGLTKQILRVSDGDIYNDRSQGNLDSALRGLVTLSANLEARSTPNAE